MKKQTKNMVVILVVLVGLTFAATMFLGIFKFSIFAGPPKYSDWRVMTYNEGTGTDSVYITCSGGEDPSLKSGLDVNEINFCEFSYRNSDFNAEKNNVETSVWKTLQPGQSLQVKGPYQTRAFLIGLRTGTYHWVGDGICDSQTPYLESYQNSPQDCQFLDSDKDGVPDSLDKCPAEVGVRENFGCPQSITPPPTFLETTTTTSVTATTIQQPIGGTSTTTTSTMPITTQRQELGFMDWVIVFGFIGAILIFGYFYFKTRRRR